MLQPGTLLQNRYRVVSHLGQGGMGAVYVATDERFGSTVALKETFFRDAAMLRAFEREARLLNHLRHPALPRVSDHFAEGDGQFLVMEFIAGEDLSAMLARRGSPFPVRDVLNWADELLDALDYLHAQSPTVVHRDIKPQNLKLTPRGQIILLDFGLAKGAPSQASHPTASVYGYSRNYAPIEQIQGTGTDTRSDIYSLGATLYHLITGQPPADAITRAMAVLNGSDDPLRPADEINPQVPRAVSDALARAMRQTAAARTQTAAKMRDELQIATRQTLSYKQKSNRQQTLPTIVPEQNPLFSERETVAEGAAGSTAAVGEAESGATANYSPATANVSPATVPLASEQETRILGADGASAPPTVRASSPAPTEAQAQSNRASISPSLSNSSSSAASHASSSPQQHGETTVVAAAPRRSKARPFAVAAIAAALCAAVAAFAYTFMRQSPTTQAQPAAAPQPSAETRATDQTANPLNESATSQTTNQTSDQTTTQANSKQQNGGQSSQAGANGSAAQSRPRPVEPQTAAQRNTPRGADEPAVGEHPAEQPSAPPVARPEVPDDALIAPNTPPPGLRLPPNIDWARLTPAQRKRVIRMMRRQIQEDVRRERLEQGQPIPQQPPFPRRRRQPPPQQ